MSNVRQNHVVLLINICGSLTALVYLTIFTLQQTGPAFGLGEFLLAETLLVALWLGAFAAYGDYNGIRWLLLWALVFRLIGVLAMPILEDDWYRYLWDGYRFVTEGTPYGAAPSQFFTVENLPGRFSEIVGQINNPELPTIYGPALQYVFALAYLISPGELWGLKLIMVVIDFGVIAILLRLTAVKYVLLYAWCPLVIKEIAFTAHPDGIGVFLLLAAFYCRLQRFYAAAVIMAGLAVAAKVFALLLVPWVLWRLTIKYWLLFALTLAAVYAPFVLQGSSDFFSLFVFARFWEFNAALYAVVNLFLPDTSSKVLLGLIFGSWLLWYFVYCQKQPAFSIPRADWVFGLFFLISPVINAWYWLWLLPFAAIFPSVWAWTASVALLLSYCIGLHIPGSALAAYEIPLSVRIAEFGLIALAVLVDLGKRQKNSHK